MDKIAALKLRIIISRLQNNLLRYIDLYIYRVPPTSTCRTEDFETFEFHPKDEEDVSILEQSR
jgi:hypothetical protein